MRKKKQSVVPTMVSPLGQPVRGVKYMIWTGTEEALRRELTPQRRMLLLSDLPGGGKIKFWLPEDGNKVLVLERRNTGTIHAEQSS